MQRPAVYDARPLTALSGAGIGAAGEDDVVGAHAAQSWRALDGALSARRGGQQASGHELRHEPELSDQRGSAPPARSPSRISSSPMSRSSAGVLGHPAHEVGPVGVARVVVPHQEAPAGADDPDHLDQRGADIVCGRRCDAAWRR